MKVLILGNSITKHGYLEDVGWYNSNFGMAASCKEKDYAHILMKKINEIEPSDFIIENISDFELFFENPYNIQNDIDNEFNQDRRNFVSIEHNFKKFIDFNADLVIFAIGENVGQLLTEEKRSHFKEQLIHLFNAISHNGKAKIVVRSCFWAAPDRDKILQEACAEVNGIFVDISENAYLEKYYGSANRKFWHGGVANHPGDEGMAMIADCIWEKLSKEI